MGPRVYYAMAKNRAFFSAAAKVHPRWHTPVVAILSQGLCAMLMTLTPFPELVDLHRHEPDAVHACSRWRRCCIFRKRAPGWQRLRAVDFAYPLIPAAYILVGACMMIYGVIRQPRASLTAFATVGLGALVYRFRIRRLREPDVGLGTREKRRTLGRKSAHV